MLMKLTLHATTFAALAHEGQERKYTGTPYIWHPIRVAIKVASVTDDQEMIAAALMHDTIEDTDTTYEDILKKFGRRTADLVLGLTNIATPEDGNRAARRKIDKDFTAQQNPDVKTIRLADVADNLTDIMVADPGFARIYVKEKRDLMKVLTEGDPTLYAEVRNIIGDYYLERNSSN